MHMNVISCLVILVAGLLAGFNQPSAPRPTPILVYSTHTDPILGDSLVPGSLHPDSVGDWLSHEIGFYNMSSDLTLPSDSVSTTFFAQGTGEGEPELHLSQSRTESVTYVVLHWGETADTAESWEAYYLPASTGRQQFAQPAELGGLESYYAYGPRHPIVHGAAGLMHPRPTHHSPSLSVPNAANTLALAGLGTLGLMGFATRFRRR